METISLEERASLLMPEDKPILDAKNPMYSADEILLRKYKYDGSNTLLHYQGSFYVWSNGCYIQEEENLIRSVIWKFLGKAEERSGSGETVPFKPTKSKVADVLDALKARAIETSRTIAPCWLDGNEEYDAGELVPCKNGALHLPTDILLPQTPKLFTFNAITHNYDPKSSMPVEWLKFLDEVFINDQEAIDTLQEIFGLLLTNSTIHQKIFLIVGPKRSGKGTIGRVLTSLLGQNSVAGPTLGSLANQFGLAPLIGKQVAIISDARLSGKADQSAIAERLLTISGEDSLNIPRKFLGDYTARLSARFLLMTNELPRLSDASGALASRFVVLNMTQSFFGKEDLGLTSRLLKELPQILTWAVQGWRRLNDRGYFKQPKSALSAISEIEDLASPISAFIRDECETGAGLEVKCCDLFEAWKVWCSEQGRDHPGTKPSFGRDLRAAAQIPETKQKRVGGKPLRYYEGISLSRTVTRDTPLYSSKKDIYKECNEMYRVTSSDTCPRCDGEGCGYCE